MFEFLNHEWFGLFGLLFVCKVKGVAASLHLFDVLVLMMKRMTDLQEKVNEQRKEQAKKEKSRRKKAEKELKGAQKELKKSRKRSAEDHEHFKKLGKKLKKYKE